jgi:hypothetical protein
MISAKGSHTVGALIREISFGDIQAKVNQNLRDQPSGADLAAQFYDQVPHVLSSIFKSATSIERCHIPKWLPTATCMQAVLMAQSAVTLLDIDIQSTDPGGVFPAINQLNHLTHLHIRLHGPFWNHHDCHSLFLKELLEFKFRHVALGEMKPEMASFFGRSSFGPHPLCVEIHAASLRATSARSFLQMFQKHNLRNLALWCIGTEAQAVLSSIFGAVHTVRLIGTLPTAGLIHSTKLPSELHVDAPKWKNVTAPDFTGFLEVLSTWRHHQAHTSHLIFYFGQVDNATAFDEDFEHHQKWRDVDDIYSVMNPIWETMRSHNVQISWKLQGQCIV